MRKFLLGFIAVFCCGCMTGMIRAEAVDGTLRAVAGRHDKYITADSTLVDIERRIYLRDTELLTHLLDEAQK